jgi:hypothetical protein
MTGCMHGRDEKWLRIIIIIIIIINIILFYYFFSNTVQCGSSPPVWTSPSQLCFLTSPIFNCTFINIWLYTVKTSVLWSHYQSTSLMLIVKHLTYFSFTIHSINITILIQPTLTNEGIWFWTTSYEIWRKDIVWEISVCGATAVKQLFKDTGFKGVDRIQLTQNVVH